MQPRLCPRCCTGWVRAGPLRAASALVAQADAKGAFSTLFLGLGAVALLPGAIGVANIMVIAVPERRSEIGLRRALGATRGHIRIQFLAEATVLALAGGAAAWPPRRLSAPRPGCCSRSKQSGPEGASYQHQDRQTRATPVAAVLVHHDTNR